ncbi:MAG TPA: hypothetical protein VNX68_06280, partial [Nitrosopumilaceae archaeon]|nr:hypothetical protein [Nitrosopumilaceae archaeon]
MKLEDIEITFGKSILIEKSQKGGFLNVINEVCKDVPGSFLHCFVSSSGWITIIRYAKLKINEKLSDDYCLLRILLLKNINCEDSNLNEVFFRKILHHLSIKQTPNFIHLQNGSFNIVDSCPIICHKESLPAVIMEIMPTLLSLTTTKTTYAESEIIAFTLSIPFAFSDKLSECLNLY